MKKPSNENIRDSIIGLGENSIRKNYYPQLKKKITEVKELNRTLEEKVEQRTKELQDTMLEQQQTNEKLQHTLNELQKTQKSLVESEKMAALGELVAGIAHEINTPIGIGLTGVTHFLEMTKKIKENYTEDNLSQEEFENYLYTAYEIAETIHLNILRSADLVRNFKQIAVDQSSETRRVFNVYTYMHTILSSIHSVIKKTKLSVTIDCDKQLQIESYPGIYSQIITNFIINSITHAYEEKEPGEINITVTKEKKSLKVIYTDDGKGIEQENLQKIFNPFFTTNREKGGSGLGLNIIYNLITNNLQGEVQCQSTLGKGTTFIFTDTVMQEIQ